ncbi:hypothetical protein PAPYR_7043 [Paratrimastix pyriformis]|uniref:Protein OS9-like domain-containing protein n=1 Tax=Paratrimastix pyriformis TaxID=342808 RepID=A0ABQ8UHT5_9EUKA|nr:hypothetical protein PAPYR_7043 [Paratrimastix pyriformis]
MLLLRRKQWGNGNIMTFLLLAFSLMHLSFCEDALRIQAEEEINHHLFFAPAFPGPSVGEDDAITPTNSSYIIRYHEASFICSFPDEELLEHRLPSGPGQVALKFRLPAEPAVVPTKLSEGHTVEELVVPALTPDWPVLRLGHPAKYAPPHARFQFRPEGTPTHPEPAALPVAPSTQHQPQQPQPTAGPAPRSPEEIVKETFSGGLCLIGGAGYWTYEACPGLHIRQYHSDRLGVVSGQITAGAPILSTILFLGRGGGRPGTPPPESLIFTQSYLHGNRCHEIGADRTSTLHFFCPGGLAGALGTNRAPTLVHFAETDLCTYVGWVQVPALCEAQGQLSPLLATAPPVADARHPNLLRGETHPNSRPDLRQQYEKQHKAHADEAPAPLPGSPAAAAADGESAGPALVVGPDGVKVIGPRAASGTGR